MNKTDEPTDYARGWYFKMVEIWRDRVDLLRIRDTGSLRHSIRTDRATLSADRMAFSFVYLQYGIYVDLGVGNGYTHGNGGDLPFLNPAYRLEHHLGTPRRRRVWFSRSWYISVLVLKDKLAEVIGEKFSGLFDNLSERERG